MARTKTVVEEPVKKRGRPAAKVEEPVKKTRGRKPAAEVVEEPVKKTRGRKPAAEVEETPKRRGRKPAAEVVEEPVKKTRGRKPVEEVVEETKPRRKSAKQEIKEEAEALFDPYADLTAVLDKIERVADVNSGTLDLKAQRVSTGTLCKDLILNGGLTGGGWYTNFGQEQCAKTTDAVITLFNMVAAGVPIAALWDYEGSTTPEYQESMLQTNNIKMSVSDVFGLRDPHTGKWIKAPKVRLYQEGIAERFFDWLASLLRKLPDKKKMGDQWYLIYPFTKENQALLKGKYDAAYFREFKKFRVKAANGLPQAVVVVDSYPGMLPEDKDVDDPNGAVGAQARMFADQIKRVKGKLKPKNVIVYGVNQLRLRPMAKGDPEYETGGEALKIFSDVRLKLVSRALSSVPGAWAKSGRFEEEQSVEGKGKDIYRYVHVRAHKNKLGTPNLETWIRLWTQDRKGRGRGIDPVWDTYWFLKETGQLSGQRNKIKLHIDGKEAATKAVTWLTFKEMVLGDKEDVTNAFQVAGMGKPYKIRDLCFKQLAAGKAQELFFKKLEGSDTDDDDPAADEEPTDDDD